MKLEGRETGSQGRDQRSGVIQNSLSSSVRCLYFSPLSSYSDCN